MYYITGDTHGDFTRIFNFVLEKQLSSDDVIIILGDSGLNYFVKKDVPDSQYYYDSKSSLKLKKAVNDIGVKFFIVHGNHEARANEVYGYQRDIFCGGSVFYQEAFPNILFAEDGEFFIFNDKSVFVCGGAYSVDKYYRLKNGYNWFSSEMPNEQIKAKCFANLKQHKWRADYIFSHTCPKGFIPKEAFLKGINQASVDSSTEEFLQTVLLNMSFDKWYCGHFHIAKKLDDYFRFMFMDIDVLDTISKEDE